MYCFIYFPLNNFSPFWIFIIYRSSELFFLICLIRFQNIFELVPALILMALSLFSVVLTRVGHLCLLHERRIGNFLRFSIAEEKQRWLPKWCRIDSSSSGSFRDTKQKTKKGKKGIKKNKLQIMK